MMQADLNKTSSPHWYCYSQYEDYDLWLYYRDLVPMQADCWLDNMRLKWRDGKVEDAGITIKLVGDHLSPHEDINNGFAKDLWSDLLSGVQDLGYSATSPHVGALHYDWRLSLEQLMLDGTFAKMQKQIEAHVASSGGKKAIIVTLSYGGPLVHKFLAKFVDSAWKHKFVERWISLSGVFGGSVVLTRMAFYPEAKDFFNIPEILPYISLEMARDMSNTFSSSFTLRPTYMEEHEVLISAQVEGEQRNYTTNSVGLALEDSGLSAARQVYESSQYAYSFDHLGEPGVTVDCMYGTGEKTLNSVHFGDGFNKPATAYAHEDGDGVATTRSLSLCARWNETKVVGNNTPKVSVYKFPHIDHGGILHSNESCQQFANILHSMYQATTRPSLFV